MPFDAETYDSPGLERREGEAVADVLRSYVCNARKVLDLGWGTGPLPELLDVDPKVHWSLF